MPASPFFRRTTLFTAGDGGYPLYRIPGVIATAAGTLLVYCEARQSLRGDWGTIDLLLRRSTDGGQTWSPPQRMNPPALRVPRNTAALAQGLGDTEAHTFNNPLAIADAQPGVVHFLFCAEYASCFYRRSLDDGQTWSAPVDITAAFEALRPVYPWRVIATGPGHGIQLGQPAAQPGRLIVPVWLSDGTGGHAHRPSAVATLFSDDGGQRWQAGEIVVNHGPLATNPSETAVVALADGRVLLNMRSESPARRRLVSTSPDGATRWSPPVPDPALYEPVCAAGLARLPQPTADGPRRSADGRTRLLFSNPDSRALAATDPGAVMGKRQNLTVRLSEDDGRSWPLARVLDPGLAGYSDLAVGPGSDPLITCAYEGGGAAGNAFASSHLSVAQFNLAWLYAKQ